MLKGDKLSLFLAACWWIWRARNLLCLESVTITKKKKKIGARNIVGWMDLLDPPAGITPLLRADAL